MKYTSVTDCTIDAKKSLPPRSLSQTEFTKYQVLVLIIIKIMQKKSYL